MAAGRTFEVIARLRIKTMSSMSSLPNDGVLSGGVGAITQIVNVSMAASLSLLLLSASIAFQVHVVTSSNAVGVPLMVLSDRFTPAGAGKATITLTASGGDYNTLIVRLGVFAPKGVLVTASIIGPIGLLTSSVRRVICHRNT